jgi:hypothetical protein
MHGISKKLDTISDLERKLQVKKALVLEEALSGNDPASIIKAQDYINSIIKSPGQTQELKSYLTDPFDFINGLGYKDRVMQMSYNTLLRMAKAPIIGAILKTRTTQIASFAEPQKDKYSTGFVIRKKRNFGDNTPSTDVSKSDQKKIGMITEFILNCGRTNTWENTDDFDTFIRKVVRDSLIYDQMTFEVVRDKKGPGGVGLPYMFKATDASTFRIAESIQQEYRGPMQPKNGFYPTAVQIQDGAVTAEFYPWELCFGVRNASTNIRSYGYGCSELEDLIHTVTAMLWSDEYNRRMFSQGSFPKGIIKVTGNISPTKLQEFKQQWQSMMSGVYQSHKTPIMEADKMEFVNLSTTNKDMEFGNWQDYLIKIGCAHYCMSPEEIGFGTGDSSGQRAVFEGNNEAKLEHSKDKGLYPLLKFIAARLNKYVVSQIDPAFELAFTGMDSSSPTEELDAMIKKVSCFMTPNEARKEYNMEPIEGADIIGNPILLQAKQMEQQAEMQKQQMDMQKQQMSQQQDDAAEQEQTDSNPYEGQ